ncbi:MAG: response regulator [Candidatus Omnitrophota bacterium]
MKILVADDTKIITDLLNTYLTRKGHTIEIAENGLQAKKMIKENNYDVAFIDHNMPEMTGMELVKFIKENKIRTKTVILTGYSGMQDFFAKSVGVDEYLSKPCELEDIDKIINKFSSEIAAPSRRKKILIVDDEAHVVKLMEFRLKANGYDVITASNGVECIEKIMAAKPDLILLDVMMPEMDGYSTLITLKELRQSSEGDESIPKIPVLILSACAGEEIRSLLETEEISGYLTKPFSAEELLAKIKEILN